MQQAVLKRPSTVAFWDGYAQWYKLWMEHNHYHDEIINILLTQTEPEWKVLDIGAGSGVLSLPLCAYGCDVTALEPSWGMRNLLQDRASHHGIDWITVDERKWEDVQPYGDFNTLDLVMACNSLHLTEAGFIHALDKMFQTRAKNVFVVTESSQTVDVRMSQPGYSLIFAKSYDIDDSFHYHCIEELYEHQSFRGAVPAVRKDDRTFLDGLHFRNGHFVVPSIAKVTMHWWRRNDATTAGNYFDGKDLQYGLVKNAC